MDAKTCLKKLEYVGTFTMKRMLFIFTPLAEKISIEN